MPIQKRKTGESSPVSFRPGALQRDRLDQLIEYRQQNQSTVINAAIDLLWMFDVGFDRVDYFREADILTDNGQNDPNKGEIEMAQNSFSPTHWSEIFGNETTADLMLAGFPGGDLAEWLKQENQAIYGDNAQEWDFEEFARQIMEEANAKI